MVFELQSAPWYALLRITLININTVGSNNNDQSLFLKIVMHITLFKHEYKIARVDTCSGCSTWYYLPLTFVGRHK